MNINKFIMSIIPKNKNWLSDNIASIIALSFIWYTFYVFKLVLLKEVKTSESQTITIINSITNILMLIVGYYFGSSKGSKDKEQKINELEEKKLDLTNKVGLFIIAILLLSSCISQNRRARICNSCPVKIERHDSIVEKIVEVPVLVPGKPGPTVFLENPCKFLCDSNGKLKQIDGTIKKNNQNLFWKTKGNGIEIAASTEDTTIKAQVKSKESFSSKQDTVVIEKECKRDHRTDFDGVCRWFFYIFAPLTALYVFLKIKKIVP